MKDSVLVEDQDHCLVCGSGEVQRHHVFFGTSNRKNADEDGYWVPLCMEHHTGTRGVHRDLDFNRVLKTWAQREFEKTHTRTQFIERYGRSYL